ncbi:MAG: linear amide C-N hydrolase [Bacteroidales bacterium]|nr:linear amide C-N hydrolase [Bacteroidales bacterium]
MNKIIKAFFLGILGAVLMAVVVIAVIWGGEIRTIMSVENVDGNPFLYQMEYKAAYDLDELIEQNIDSNGKLLEYVIKKVGKGLPIKIKSAQVADENGQMNTFNCTSFQVKNQEGDGYLFGRNYDYFKNPTMVTYSYPRDGYASIACSDMSHFGYSLEKVPSKFISKIMCVASVYAPVDGMNEKGLCVSIMALPKQPSQQDTEKPNVGTTIIMRLMLDRCATVQEALELAESVDICHDTTVGSGYHYMVADASGDCAVIEFDPEGGWETMVVRKEDGVNSMLVTNHLLSPKYYTEFPDQKVGNTHSRSWWRYDVAGQYIAERQGIMSLEEAQEALDLVHWKDLKWENGIVEDTQFSNVYDQSEKTLHLRNWNTYETTNTFELKSE